MWGEINNSMPEINSNIDLTPVMEQSRQRDCLSKYQIPSSILATREISIPSMDPRMLYAAELHKCIEKMSDTIYNAELAIKYNLQMTEEMPPISAPVPPEIPCTRERKYFPFVEKEYSDFTMGFGRKPPMISELTRKEIQKKCIATMLCHIGFLYTDNTVLEVLQDVFESFMQKICGDLRFAKDMEQTVQTSGFCDIVERVFAQNGLGGIAGVFDYYQHRIIKYEQVLKKRFTEIVAHYEELQNTVSAQTEVRKVEGVEDSDSNDVPEVHLSAMDGEEEYMQPFLESGFQMLNSLEKGQYTT